MKKIILPIIAILSFCVTGYSQTNIQKMTDAEIDAAFAQIKETFAESPEEWVFTKVIQAEGHSAVDILNAANEALLSVYSSCKDVIQEFDKDGCKVIGKGYVTSDVRTQNAFTIALYRPIHLVKVEAKDNRYKVTLSIKETQIQCGAQVDANQFGNATVALSYYFPYDRNFKKSLRPVCWDLLNFIYTSANGTISEMEKKVSAKLSSGDDW